MPKMMQKSYAMVHQAKCGNFPRMSAMSEATNAINQASCNRRYQSVIPESMGAGVISRTYICNRYCRERKRVSHYMSCDSSVLCPSCHDLANIPKLKRPIAPLPIPKRWRPLPSMLPFIFRRDGECRLPYDGMEGIRPAGEGIESQD